MPLISLKLYYNKQFKQEHLDKYGERHCDDIVDQINNTVYQYLRNKQISTDSQYILPSDANCGCVPHIRLEIKTVEHIPVQPIMDHIIAKTQNKIDRIKIG